MSDASDSQDPGPDRLGEPEILRIGKEFEEMFRAGYLGPDDFEAGIAVCRGCQVVRSRGTEKSIRVDGDGNFVEDPYADATLKTISPIVIQGLGFVDLFVIYTDNETGLQCHVVIEIKNTKWDERQRSRIVPLMGSHRRQIYGYLEPLEFRSRRKEIAHPQAIVVYPTRPQLEGRDELVREYFEAYGIWVEYAEELLSDAGPIVKPPDVSDLCKQAWLRESPACEICAPGEVIIREGSKSAGARLREQHLQMCPAKPA